MKKMKKLLLILICLPFIGFGQPSNVNIPDANFKAYLVGNTAINTNGDNEIQVSEATPFVGSINCSNLGIFDLTGIEAFTALTNLNCEQNQLAILDVSTNTDLTSLICNTNQLTILDVSANISLTVLGCVSNQLNSLDVSANTALTNLNCEQNQLTSLDVRNGNNTAFTNFTTTNNPNLFCIDVDDNGYSAANWTNIDATHYFSTNCSPTNSIYDLITNSALTILQTAVDTCGGAAALQGPGPFTLFAPTDAAFNALGQANLLQLLGDIPTLTNILTHHVVGDSVMSGMLSNGQVVTTLLGNDVTVTINSNGDVFIDNAQVIIVDIVADNGVVHVIDAVLLPITTLVSEINELNNKYLHSVNILGKKISRDAKNQIILDIYSNGNIIKRYTK